MQLLTSATPLERQPQNTMLLTSMYFTENYDRMVTQPSHAIRWNKNFARYRLSQAVYAHMRC
jgi:hypothetical protein